MESFVLTCTTCKSRLKVRDTGVVGQIMACPKCGGMVLIKPPEPGTPREKSSSETGETKPDLASPLRPLPPIDASSPLKADAFDDVDVLLGDVPPRTMVPAPTVRSTTPHAAPANTAPLMKAPLGTHSIIRPLDSKTGNDSQAQTLSQNDIPVAPAPAKKVSATPAPAKPAESAQRVAAAAAMAAAVPQVAATTTPALPEQTTIEPAAQPTSATAAGTLAGSPWQYWALVSASGLLGILLAVGVVAITISWFSNGTEPITPAVAQNNPPVPPAVSENSPTPTPPTVPKTPAIPPNTAVAVAPVPPANPASEPVVPPPLPTEVPRNPTNPAPPMPTAVERDPLGLTEPPPAVKPELPTNDPFKKFGDILGGGPTEPMPPEQPPVAEPPAPAAPVVEEEPNPSPTAAKLPKPEPRHIDIAARLADPLPAVEISNSPLADFLQVMQGLSTVPITLRPDGLGMVRFIPFNSETPVSWKGSSTTVLDAIQGALKPLGLEARIEADQLIVDVASPQMVTTKLAVKDLTASDERRAAEIAALLLTFVANESWGDEEGQPIVSATKDELTVRQHRTQLAECILLVEKLRIARGLPLASKFEPKLFALATRSERAQAALATPITLNYSIPTPLLRVAERLGKDAKVRILFDWQSLSAAGWNPDAEVTLSVEKQPLAAALTDLTKRMDLTWRVVDARTIQILSPQTLADRTELEFYSIKDLAADEPAGAALIAKIRTALGGQVFRDAGGRGELRFDATGKCLLAALSQPQQQELAKLLRGYREALSAR